LYRLKKRVKETNCYHILLITPHSNSMQ